MKHNNNEFLELNIGCGTHKKKRYYFDDKDEFQDNVIRLDINPECEPDVKWDLNIHPLPFADELFDEIHAYDILEHLGSQGDYQFFFNEFNEYYRIIKPDGLFFGIVPNVNSGWAFGDPGHKRIFHKRWLLFLNPDKYEELGTSAMSDYRDLLKCNFKVVDLKDEEESLCFILKAVKNEH